MVTLEESVVLVTGAASGMGEAMAHEFAARGAEVVVVDIDEDGATAVAGAVTAEGGTAIAAPADVADEASVRAAVERAVDEFGTVDVLCNNAGVFDGDTPAGETSLDLWERVVGVNLRGPFLTTRAALPELRAGDDEGVVVTTASVAAKTGGAGGVAYTASKHGVVGLTRHLASAYGPEVRANAVCPGFVETGLTEDILDELAEKAARTPAERYAGAEEIARIVAFLASDDASFVNGVALDADGGLLANNTV